MTPHDSQDARDRDAIPRCSETRPRWIQVDRSRVDPGDSTHGSRRWAAASDGVRRPPAWSSAARARRRPEALLTDLQTVADDSGWLVEVDEE